jgi:hypothetical protein
MNNPEVFRYAIGDIEGGRVYSLLFYGGFVVHAMRKPTAAEVASQDHPGLYRAG